MAYNYLRNFLDPIDFHIDIYGKFIHITNYLFNNSSVSYKKYVRQYIYLIFSLKNALSL